MSTKKPSSNTPSENKAIDKKRSKKKFTVVLEEGLGKGDIKDNKNGHEKRQEQFSTYVFQGS
jgi:C4-type Zn-finger protein